MNIELNPNLDVEALAKQFKSDRMLRVSDILTLDSAEIILETLKNTTAWSLVHSTESDEPKIYLPEDLEKLTQDELTAIYSDVYSRAATSYQFAYKYFPIIDAIHSKILTPASLLYELATFLNGTEFLKFARKLTDTDSLVKLDPQASLYEPGHFLNTHDDNNDTRTRGDGSTRRFAVVFGFTKNWSSNWGGQTMFFESPTAGIAQSWNPSFNTLSIFEVPTLHCVNYITPFAPKGRYAVTGWLRDDPSVLRPDLDE